MKTICLRQIWFSVVMIIIMIIIVIQVIIIKQIFNNSFLLLVYSLKRASLLSNLSITFNVFQTTEIYPSHLMYVKQQKFQNNNARLYYFRLSVLLICCLRMPKNNRQTLPGHRSVKTKTTSIVTLVTTGI